MLHVSIHTFVQICPPQWLAGLWSGDALFSATVCDVLLACCMRANPAPFMPPILQSSFGSIFLAADPTAPRGDRAAAAAMAAHPVASPASPHHPPHRRDSGEPPMTCAEEKPS